jgi:hypothetical protein
MFIRHAAAKFLESAGGNCNEGFGDAICMTFAECLVGMAVSRWEDCGARRGELGKLGSFR